MKIGVICEGHTDRAVIENILKGLRGVDSCDLIPIRPQSDFDETDISKLPPNSFGGWDAVRHECQNQMKIREFLSIEGQDFIVIHLDSAEANQYHVTKPSKDAQYSTNLRNLIVQKIDEWLIGIEPKPILYAIAIEEIEAWILTIYERKDSSVSADPKARLSRTLARLSENYDHNYDGFKKISKPFTKHKNYAKHKYLEYNASLNAFCKEVLEKIPTESE